MSSITKIPGIGRTFGKDFARIGVTRTADLRHADPDKLYKELVLANRRDEHKTSKNYLYVIRMCVYYANGGRNENKLRWSAWKDQS